MKKRKNSIHDSLDENLMMKLLSKRAAKSIDESDSGEDSAEDKMETGREHKAPVARPMPPTKIFKNLSDSNLITSFPTQLNRLHKAIAFYESEPQGFKQLIFRTCHPDANINNNFTPLEDYHNERDMPMGERTSIRLFLKNQKIYFVPYRALLNNIEPPTPTLINEEQCIFVIVLIRKADQNFCYELRVTKGVTSGHIGLVGNNKFGGVVCAGEFFQKDHQLFYANDKTGYFHQKLAPYKTMCRSIFELYFNADLNYHFHNVPDLCRDEDIKEELKRLGFYNKESKNEVLVNKAAPQPMVMEIEKSGTGTETETETESTETETETEDSQEQEQFTFDNKFMKFPSSPQTQSQSQVQDEKAESAHDESQSRSSFISYNKDV